MMSTLRFLPAVVLGLIATTALADNPVRTEKVKFEEGRNDAVFSGKIRGRESISYKLNAKDGQFLTVRLLVDKPGTCYNIYIPGRGLGDDPLFDSLNGGNTYTGQLYKTGEHSVLVFLNGPVARSGEKSEFEIVFQLSSKPPGAESSSEPVRSKAVGREQIIRDCLEATRKQVGRGDVSLISIEQGETAWIVKVKVPGAQAPWLCRHDGRKVTQVMYLGEG